MRLFSLAVMLFFFISVSVHGEPNQYTYASYESYMKRLITLSQQNKRFPFAAMIIDNKTGKILCEGVNSTYVNPTYHGEMVAINNCASQYPKLNWSTTTLITTAEPCPMCESAIVWSNISKVVYGTSIAFLKKQGWNQIDIYSKEIVKKSAFYRGSVLGGIRHKETDKLFLVPPK